MALNSYSLLSDTISFTPSFEPHCQFQNEGAGVRQLMILKHFPTLVLAGDLLGDLNVWNVKSKCLQYSVPEPCTLQGKKRSLFRIAGAVVGMSQVESNGTIAVAFGSDRVDLFSSKDAFNMLKLLRTIDLNSPELKSLPQRSGNHQYVRSILLTKTELYICGMSENYGLLLLDFWQ